MGFRFVSRRRGGGAFRISWYVRVGLYLGILLVIAYAVNGMRGRIPMAFGLTPIRVKALSVEKMPYDLGDSTAGGMADVSVRVRIIANRKAPEGIRLAQFHLVTDGGAEYQPYASTLPFDSLGALRFTAGDTVFGALMFMFPRDDKPDQLWWRP